MIRFLLALALLLLGILAAVLVTPSFLLVVGGPVAILAFTVKKHRRYALDVWLGFDKFANACIGGNSNLLRPLSVPTITIKEW